MKDFLLELGTEEVPASYLEPASRSMEEIILSLLKDKGISFGRVKNFYTPRRLAILIKAVSPHQRERILIITGPAKDVAFKDGKPQKSLLGFCKAQNIGLRDIKITKKGKREVVGFEKRKEGEKTEKILAEVLPELIKRIEFPKSMRWESSEIKFARPIRWILCLFGNRVIPFKLAGIKSGRFSRGLRGYPDIEIDKPISYEKNLYRNFIIVDPEKRKQIIREEIERVSKPLKWLPDEELLSEVNNLVEYPVAVPGKFNSKYLKLPKEVVRAALKGHQRYFSLLKANGKMSNSFVSIANTKDGDLNVIKRGNEKVLRARLEDAEFYYKEDTKERFEKKVEELKGMIWQRGLGTLYEKTERITELSQFISQWVSGIDGKILRRASRLSKADLATNMIKDGKEFTKLEGIIGRDYAIKSGEKNKVAVAIEEHYLPRFSGDRLPETLEGICLSLADRMDTISGASIIHSLPTGSSDKLGIRKCANGMITIILEKSISLPLSRIIKESLKIYGRARTPLDIEILNFLLLRFKTQLQDMGIKYDTIDAVLSVNIDDICELKRRAKIVESFRDKNEFKRIVTLSKRVNNILKGVVNFKECNEDLLKETAEKELWIISRSAKNRLRLSENYKNSLEILLSLGEPIDKLFDDVLVMAKDRSIRENRLALLKFVSNLFYSLGNFGKIVTS